MLPISISKNPQVLIRGGLSEPVNKEDLNILKKWIIKYRTSLYKEWVEHAEAENRCRLFNELIELPRDGSTLLSTIAGEFEEFYAKNSTLNTEWLLKKK
jgi:hypothetical protein